MLAKVSVVWAIAPQSMLAKVCVDEVPQKSSMLHTAPVDAPQVWIRLALYSPLPHTLPYCDCVQSVAELQLSTHCPLAASPNCEYPVGQGVDAS
jgi:hypothetical protein